MRIWTVVLFALLALGIFRGDDQLDRQSAASAAEVWSELSGLAQWPVVSGTSPMMPGQAPHGKFITVHYNEIARTAIADNRLKMPDGAIFAKENFDSNRVLHLITTMKKMNGAWFWAEYEPDGTVQVAGKVKGCEECHTGARRDFVFTWR